MRNTVRAAKSPLKRRTAMHNAFPPLLGENPEILILGTFPSPLSRGKGEYYGNPRNQFWRIIFDIFGQPFDDPPYSRKTEILAENGIALWDTLVSCNADNALDSSIRNPVYNTAIPGFIAEHCISRVFFNGGNAYTFYKRGVGHVERNVLPSTSPANARMSYSGKLEIWRASLAESDRKKMLL